MKRGDLFVFEGADEVGKTTIAAKFAEELRRNGTPCHLIAFPGTQPGTLGWHVYEVHHEPKRFNIQRMNPTSLQLLHVAAHIDTIDSEILPALRKGHTVVLDRFWWSSWVYGVTYGGNRASLKTAISAEMIHWKAIIPTHLFLITRKSPLEPQRDLEVWKAIRDFYQKFAAQQKRVHLVSTISNGTAVEDALRAVLEKIQPRKLRLRKPRH